MEFKFKGFDRQEYTEFQRKIDSGEKGSDIDFIGNIRVGELCFDLVARDYDDADGGDALDYDCYVGGEEGYSETPHGYPYGWGGGGNLGALNIFPDMSYDEFMEKAEAELEKFISENPECCKYSLMEKANMPFHDWN